jgi:CBS domain-containing protein
VETATISYRVADFLKKHPPFNTMADADLLEFAPTGRVRFYERNEYILWQGEPHRSQIFVIQQGTVSLWDESKPTSDARPGSGLGDVRGAGDMLGIERFNGARSTVYTVRSESDVVIYAFPAEDFDALLMKYERARQYVTTEAGVTLDYQTPEERRDLTSTFLYQLVAHGTVARCDAGTSIREAARRLAASGTGALTVVGQDQRVHAVVTPASFVTWIADGNGDADAPVETLSPGRIGTVGPDTTVVDGVLTMAHGPYDALAITNDSTPGGTLSAVVSARDLGTVFGDQPLALLSDIRSAGSTDALRVANHRARAFALRHLTSAVSVDWLSRLLHAVDIAIVRKLIAFAGADALPACWCFAGSSGRSESPTRLAPQLVLLVSDGSALVAARAAYRTVSRLVAECDYLPRQNIPFEPGFYVATLAEWRARFSGWIGDPVRTEMSRARTLFDVTPVHGTTALWQQIEALVTSTVDQDFLHVLANDCLATLPPLTFFEDAVVDTSGEHSAVFKLEESALRPLVDVARVFSLAARAAVGRSTIERFGVARALLPEQAELFREAGDTFRVVLWQQGRIGIAEGTSGIDLPPALLSRNDRHVLKSGFRSILRLLRFTADPAWIKTL